MLIKLLVSAFERAKSKLTGPDRVSSPSSIVRFHLDSHRDTLDDETELTISVIHQQRQQTPAGRVSLSKWLCHTTNKTLVRRSSSWRSLKDRPHLSSRTRSVDELDRKASKERHRTRPPSISQGGADSGYSEDSLPAGLRPLHMSCPHCHCEQHSSFSTYPKSVKDLSTSVSSTTIDDKASASLSTSRSYPHLPPGSQPIERRRRHFSSDTRQSSNFHVFGELNLAAIERDSLRTSFTLTTRRRTFLVWHEYHNRSLLSSEDPSMLFSVTRGDQVRLLRRIGKSTLLVQKEDDGSVGFLPQTCLADDQIQSFLSVKGLRETVL